MRKKEGNPKETKKEQLENGRDWHNGVKPGKRGRGGQAQSLLRN